MTQDFSAAWRAAKEGAAWAPAGKPGLISVAGKDSAGFLHGLLSADVKKLAVGQGAPACLLTAQGKLVSPLGVFSLEGEHLLVGPAAAAPEAARLLGKMSPLSNSTVRDLTGTRQAWLVVGPRRALVLEALAGRPCDPGPDGARAFPTAAGTAHVVADFFTGAPALLLLAPEGGGERFAGAVEGAASEAGAVPLPAAALESLRLEAGIPAWGVESGPDCFPQELRLDGALDSAKGCYLGQEMMARLRDRGHVNRVLVGVKLGGPAAPGDSVEGDDGLALGHLTSVAPSPTLGVPLALAFLKPPAEPGRGLLVRAGAGRVDAVLVELPL